MRVVQGPLQINLLFQLVVELVVLCETQGLRPACGFRLLLLLLLLLRGEQCLALRRKSILTLGLVEVD